MMKIPNKDFESTLEGDPDCKIYEGDYRKEKRHGNGTSEYTDGSVYAGEWKSDSRNGFGLMSHPDGSSYEGEWKKNLKHGYGVYMYPNGDKYEGQWYKGLRHGIGTYTHLEEDCAFYGTWHDGERIGPAEIRNRNYRFHTNWMKNKPVGLSAFTFNCDTMMVGYMDTENSGESSNTTKDFRWYTKEISKYDRSKLPSEPKLHQFSDSEDESVHEIVLDSIAESFSEEFDELQDDDDNLFENLSNVMQSVIGKIDQSI